MTHKLLSASLLVLLLAGAGCVPTNLATTAPQAKTPEDVRASVATMLAAGDALSIANDAVTNLPDGVDPAQVGSAYRLGTGENSVLFAFVLQKNMNVPLLGLPEGTATAWGGVISSADGGQSWQRFLSYENPTVENLGTVRANPVGMFVEERRLYVDVADALGAGSGEGQVARFALSEDGTSWTNGGCWYYVPEIYAPVVNELLTTSTECVVTP